MKDTRKETKLVPKLRFKEFNEGWQLQYLQDIGENIIGLTYSPSDITNNETYPIVLRSSNIKDNCLYLDDLVRVKTNIPDKLKVRDGDILICTRNGSQRLIGKNIQIKLPKNYTFGAFMSVFRSDLNDLNRHIFETDRYKRQVQRNLGARINQITTAYINRFKFYYPPTQQEQQKIATFLTAVDKRIEQLTKKKKLLEEYKKGVMQKIFNQEIRFKDENGNDFPDWEENLIENQFRFKQGVQVPIENQFQTPRNENFQRFIRIIDVTQPNSDTRYIEDPGSEHHISDNDIFMIRYGTPGVVAMGYVGVIANNLFRIIPKNKTLCKRFFYYLFKFSEKQFLILSNSTSMPAISFDTLKKLLIKVPSYKEQFNIATFLDEIEKQIEKHQGQITKLSEFKQGLLQQMFI